MQTFILTLQENIFDVHHLVDFPMTVDNMTVANVSHSASMTHSCMHHSTIRRHGSDVYLGMSPVQNGGSYLMY